MKTNQTNLQERYERAINMLIYLLCESGMETDSDPEIYEMLKEFEELPEDYKPYFEN